MVKKIASLYVGLIFLFLFGIRTSFAATFTVDSTSTSSDADATLDGVCATSGGACTLKAAIQEANNVAGTDTIILPSGTFTYTSTFDGTNMLPPITESVTIQGAGIDSTIITQTGVTGRFFSTTTANLTITFSNFTISGASFAGNGGGLFVGATGGTSQVSLSYVKFLNNILTITSSNRGSGLYFQGTNIAQVTVDNCTFSGNQAGRGGAINMAETGTGGYLHITNSRFENNLASATLGNDAAVSTRNMSGFSVTIDNTTFTGNRNLFGSSFNSWVPLSQLSVTNSTFTNNTNFTGGCCGTDITIFGSSSAYTTNTITGNTFSGGNDSYIYMNWLLGPTTVANNTFSGSTGGGAISFAGTGLGVSSSPAQIYQNTINGNVFGINTHVGSNIHNNSIYGNSSYGIEISTTTEKVTIFNNAIYNNAGLGIDIDPTGINANDYGDTDSGANDLMNYPVIRDISYVGSNRFKVSGTLDAQASESPYTIEICLSDNIPTSSGGCRTYLGFTTTSTGNWSTVVDGAGNDGTKCLTFTALATNVAGSTSEYSLNQEYTGCRTGTPEHGPDYTGLSPKPLTVVEKDNVISMVPFGAFKYNSEFKVGTSPKIKPFHIPFTNYWQAGPIKDIWWVSSSNDAKIFPSEIAYPFTLIFKYDKSLLEKTTSEKTLKVVYSEDKKKWKVVSSILDIHKKQLSITTKKGGYYMLVSGGENNILSSINTLKKIYETISSPSPLPQNKPIASPVPTPKKHCFLFYCW